MKYVLFHDTTCAACSDIAQTLQTFKELSAISHTGVTGDDYGAIRKTIADNEFPILVRLADGKRWSGSRLTLKLGSMVAPRHWTEALRLYAASRQVEATGRGGPTRRTVLGGFAAGVVAAVAGVPATAMAAPKTTTPVVDPLIKQKLLQVVASRNEAWGTPTRVEHLGGATPLFIVYHSKTHFSLIPESDQTFALGMSIDAKAQKLAYYFPGSATASATVTAVDGKLKVTPGTAPSAGRVEAQASPTSRRLRCFAQCLGEDTLSDPQCFFSCLIGNVFACLVCAGAKGITCAIECR